MYDVFRPLLFRLDAERAHGLGVGAARVAQALPARLTEAAFGYERAALGQRLWGMNFPNPVGLAAGFDKNARLVRFWERLGFGFSEVGSVSAEAAPGNARPRAFRLAEDEALVNRMGLNNDGAARVARRLEQTPRERPLGINLAKTHDPAVMGAAALDDFRRSFRLLAPQAGYVALNISCPNTREGNTFEAPDALDALLSAIFEERAALDLEVPVLIKWGPPLSARVAFDSQVDEAVALAEQHGAHGFIATNTASDREGVQAPPAQLKAIGRGGLSGKPLEKRATHLVRYLYRRTEGRIPIIGVGGVDSAGAAYAKIRAGASLVQLYTALVYKGPGVVPAIKRGLVRLLERDGYGSIGAAVGTEAD